ncbi:MAG: FAD-dependent oxidoreductase [Slackia sp.]
MTMDLNRRDFLKGAGVVGALGAVATMGVGCAPSPSGKDESSDAANTAKTPNETAYKKMSEATDGKYVAKAMGHENYVFVETVVKDGAIASLQVLNHDETPGIGSLAATMWPAKVLETQNLDIDAISGATTTCNAIKNAALECLGNAGIDASEFQKGPEELTGGTEQSIDTDVVIMGAGTAGLVAATRLLEKGVKVTLFEKQDIPGGSMSMTYSGVASASSKLQENYSQGRFNDNPNYNKDAMMAVLSKYVNPEFDRFDGAMPYDHAMYDTSGALVDWLHEIGVGFYSMGVNKAYGITPYLAPGCYEGGCGQAMQYLADRVGALGGTIVYGAKVTDITTWTATVRPASWQRAKTARFTPPPPRPCCIRRLRRQPGNGRPVLSAVCRTFFQLLPRSGDGSCSARRSAQVSSAWAAS